MKEQIGSLAESPVPGKPPRLAEPRVPFLASTHHYSGAAEEYSLLGNNLIVWEQRPPPRTWWPIPATWWPIPALAHAVEGGPCGVEVVITGADNATGGGCGYIVVDAGIVTGRTLMAAQYFGKFVRSWLFVWHL